MAPNERLPNTMSLERERTVALANLTMKLRKHTPPQKELVNWLNSAAGLKSATPKQLKPLVIQLDRLQGLKTARSYLADEFHGPIVAIAPEILEQLKAKDYPAASKSMHALYDMLRASESIHAIAYNKLAGYPSKE